MSTIGAQIREGAKRLGAAPSAKIDARVLAKWAFGLSDADLIVQENNPLPDDGAALYAAAIERRARGEPVAYITGEKEFWSLTFRVTPDVLIPRDDTECLVEAALARRDTASPLRILDLGTGSGCLLVALLSEFSAASGVGVDISPAALSIARENAARNGVGDRSAFVAGRWFAPVDGRFDLIIANPPYIPERDRAGLMRDVVDFEPAGALFAGPDGMDAYREILSASAASLAPGGLMLFEAGDGQAGALADLIVENRLSPAPFVVKDLKQKARCVGFDGRLVENRD